MKRIIALTLALMMLTMSFVACNKTETPAETTESVENNQTGAPVVEETEAAVELPYANALELINIVFNGYNATATEDTMLYVAGGNINNFETTSMEGPAAFIALADSDYNDNLGIPESEASKIASAASMFNMMNTNVFNSFAVQFKDGTDVDASIEAIKANILSRQWICGAPEKLVIVKMPGDCILVVWGAVNYGGIVDPFAASIPTLVEGATIVVEHTFAQ